MHMLEMKPSDTNRTQRVQGDLLEVFQVLVACQGELAVSSG
jgi:hypothetical protein